MKKIKVNLAMAIIFALLCVNVLGQTGQGPEDMGISVTIASAQPGCPVDGDVDGSISGTSGTWWPANAVPYTGPGNYQLFVPNASTYCGYGHAWAETEIHFIPSGSFWCYDYGLDYFNLGTGDYISVMLDMIKYYNPKCEQ